MKKRIFIPHSFGFILLNIFCVAISIFIFFTLFLTALGINLFKIEFEYNFIQIIAILIGTPILIFQTIRFILALKISFKDEYLITYGDMLPKREKVQYKTIVVYNEIESIQILPSEKDSRNRRIQTMWISSLAPKKYLEFTLINKKKKSRMCINYYTKSQVIKILNCINNNMAVSGNVNRLNIDEIMEDWYCIDVPKRYYKKLKEKNIDSNKNNPTQTNDEDSNTSDSSQDRN